MREAPIFPSSGEPPPRHRRLRESWLWLISTRQHTAARNGKEMPILCCIFFRKKRGLVALPRRRKPRPAPSTMSLMGTALYQVVLEQTAYPAMEAHQIAAQPHRRLA